MGGGGEAAEAEAEGRGGEGTTHLGVPASPVLLPRVGRSSHSSEGLLRG